MILFDEYTNSPEETEKLGGMLAHSLLEDKHPRFIAMYGDLGAGKTAFVRGSVGELVPDAEVCSPTYSIINEYSGDGITICHIDAYRITDDDDLYSCGFYDYIADGAIILCEWSENIPFAIPNEHIKLEITKTGESSRHIVARTMPDENDKCGRNVELC